MAKDRVIEITLQGLNYVPLGSAVNLHGFLSDGLGEASILTPYLFSSRRWEPVFSAAQKKLHELNNVIVLLRDALENEGRYNLSVEDLSRQAVEVYGEDQLFGQEDPHQDFDQKRAVFEHELRTGLELLAYDDIGSLYAPASALVLLYATFIKILRSVGDFYAKENFINWLNERGRNPELPRLISALEHISGGSKIFTLRSPGMNELINRQAKKVRNSFVHGDWEEIERLLMRTPVHSCFNVVRKALEELEMIFTKERYPAAFTSGGFKI